MLGDLFAIYGICSKLPEVAFNTGLFFQARLASLTRQFGTPHGSALVPLVDFCNHAPQPSANQEWDVCEDTMVLRALRSHAAGEEVLISYGELSNPLLFSTFGFTMMPESEPSWSFTCGAEELRHFCCGDLTTGGLELAGLAEPLKKHLEPLCELQLDTDKLTTSLQEGLAACVLGGADPAFILHRFCTKKAELYGEDPSLAPALSALQRNRTVNSTVASWWDYEETIDNAEIAGIRVKMSEYLCLTAHIEALDLFAGKLREDQCLDKSANLRQYLRTWLDSHTSQKLSPLS